MDNLRQKVLSGATWYVAAQWLLRLLGLISTAFLARLLAPDDFGVIAVVMAIVGVVDAFFDFGFDASLIKDQNATDKDYNSAWTLRIIKTLVMASATIAVAPLLARYGDNDVLVPLSAVIALAIAIRCLENIGTVNFQKELDIQRVFLCRLFPKLGGVITSIALAWWLRSFWALAFAQVAASFYQVAVSYIVSSYRPRLDLSRARAIWSFSQWIFVRNMARQLAISADKLLLSGLMDNARLGLYSVGNSVSSIFTTEFIAPAGQVLMPAVAKVQDDPKRLRNVFLQANRAFLALIIPCGIGVWLTAPELTLLVLGDQWDEAVPIIGGLAMFYAAFTYSQVLSNMAVMMELNRSGAIWSLVTAVLFLAGLLPAYHAQGLTGVIALRVLTGVLEDVGLVVLVARKLGLPATTLFGDVVRPALAAAGMAAAIYGLGGGALPLVVTLLLKIVAGAAVYALALAVCWAVAGRPEGLESMVLGAARRKLARAP